MEKRLYRSSHNRVFLGVCSGIGEYFNTDPVIIRVIAMILTVITGVIPGIIVYLVIALVVPLEGSTMSSPRESLNENIADMRDTTVKMGQDIQNSLEKRPENADSTRPSSSSNNGIVLLGLIIIVIGIFFLIGTIFGWFWRFAWPLLLIAAGLVIIVLVARRR
jgi:phage shock protein C